MKALSCLRKSLPLALCCAGRIHSIHTLYLLRSFLIISSHLRVIPQSFLLPPRFTKSDFTRIRSDCNSISSYNVVSLPVPLRRDTVSEIPMRLEGEKGTREGVIFGTYILVTVDVNSLILLFRGRGFGNR